MLHKYKHYWIVFLYMQMQQAYSETINNVTSVFQCYVNK